MFSFPSPLRSLRLLADEPHPLEHRPGPSRGGFEPAPQDRVVVLELVQPVADLALLPHFRLRLLALQVADPGFGDEGAATKAGQLVAKMPHELLELAERKCFRTFAV